MIFLALFLLHLEFGAFLFIFFFPSWAHVAAGEEFPPLCAAAFALGLGKI